MVKFWDCFSFFSEIDLLELRIRHLWDHVNYFVISESNRTHQNVPKKFILPDLLNGELEWARKKIIPIYLEIEDPWSLPKSSYDITKENRIFGQGCDSIGWRIENYQRNSSLRVLQAISDNDIVMISDLDEIPNYNFLEMIGEITEYNSMFRLGINNHNYYLNVMQFNNGSPSNFIGNAIGKRKFLTTPQNWRRSVNAWEGGMGYHFSWMLNRIDQKLYATAHDEVQERFKLEEIRKKAINLEDIFDRPEYTLKSFNPETEDDQFPKAFIENKSKFSNLFYPVDGFNIN